MAKNNSKEDVNVRHRLVGAAALLALGVVFIPMILGGKGPGGAQSNSLNEEVHEFIIGSEDATTYTSRVKPVEVTAGQQNELKTVIDTDQQRAEPELKVIEDNTTIAAVQQPLIETPEAEKIQPVKAEKPKAEPVVKKPVEEKAKAPEPTEVASLKPEKVDRGWVVQVGTFSKSVNAQNLIGKLNKNGFDPRYEVVNTGSGQATRVWVGPYGKRVSAARALSVVQQKTGVKGFIKSFP